MKEINKKDTRKICVLVSNRSEYSRIKMILKVLSQDPEIELQIIALRTQYANNRSVLERDGFAVTEEVHVRIDERILENIPKAIGAMTEKFGKAFKKLSPDIVVILGDRYEALAATTAAAYMNLFIAHIQGGEVTGTIDEHTRHAITKLSHLHFPATKLSAERLVKIGEHPDMVYCVGCPGTDLLIATPPLSFPELRYEIYKATWQRPEVLEKFLPGYILVLQFPVVTEMHQVDEQLVNLLNALEGVDRPKVIITPNPDAGSDMVEKAIRNFEKKHTDTLILKHLPAEVFYNLMRHAALMVGNSSGGIRETGYIGVPTVNIGTRQTGRERSKNITDVPPETDAITKAIETQLAHGPFEAESIYGDGTAAVQIAAILKTVDTSRIQKRLSF